MKTRRLRPPNNALARSDIELSRMYWIRERRRRYGTFLKWNAVKNNHVERIVFVARFMLFTIDGS